MAGAEGVVRTLIALGKASDPAQHAQAAHRLAPPGENFVRIGLVPHIPYQTVFRRVVHVVQRNGQFHRAQVGR